jgi:hypothetical protein
MLLNEFLKAHRKVQELEAAVARQQKDIEALGARVKEQALEIKQAGGQSGANKSVPSTRTSRLTIGKADPRSRPQLAER